MHKQHDYNVYLIHISLYIYIPGTPMTSISEGQPLKQGLFQQTQWSFEFQVYTYIYIYVCVCVFIYHSCPDHLEPSTKKLEKQHISFFS